MSKTHNLDHYTNIYQKYLDYKQGKEKRGYVDLYFYPHVILGNECANYLNRSISSDAVKAVYNRAAGAAIASAAFFSSTLAKKIETLCYDPLDSKTVLSITARMERVLRPLAVRSATSIRLLEVLDKSLIAVARHAYIVTKDINTLMSIPTNLHLLLDRVVEEEAHMAENRPATLGGKAFSMLKEGVGIIKNSFITLIKLIFRYISIALKKIPYLEQPVSWIETACKDVKSYLNHLFLLGRKKVLHHAHQVIERNETAIRQKVMKIAAEFMIRKTLSFAVTLSITTAFAYSMYVFPKFVLGNDYFEHYARAASVWKAAGVLFGSISVLHIFYGLPADYKEKFDSEASTFRELRHLINFNNLHKLIKGIKAINSSKT